MINRLHVSKPSPSGSVTKGSTRIGRVVPARLLAMSLIFGLALLLYWLLVGRFAWRDYRFEHAGLNQLAGFCAHGDDVNACSVLSRRAIQERHTEMAIPALQTCWERVRSGRVPATTTQKAEIIGDLALADMLSGRHEEAPPLFSTATQLDYGCVPAHIAAALWLIGQNQDAHALHELEVATTLEPKNELAWLLTAHIYDQNNRLKEGREAIQKAIALNPKNPTCWQESGDNYGYADRLDESLKAYQEELKRDPNSLVAQADVARALALTAKTREEYQEATRRVQAVLAQKPTNSGEGYSELGEIQLKFGDYAQARTSYENALKDDDTIPELHYKLARARRLSGDLKGSSEAMHRYKEMYGHYQKARTLQKSLGEKPNDASLHLALAKEWEYYSAWNLAAREYQTVLTLQPGQPEATRRISDLKKRVDEGRTVTPHNWVLERLLRVSTSGAGPPAASPSGTAANPGAPNR